MHPSTPVKPSLVLAASVLCGAPALAQIPKSHLTIELEVVADGLTAPLGVRHAGDGSGRLFIFEQSGEIRIVDNGVLLPAPFLDLSPLMVDLNPGFDERGLLGLAFHPDYAQNGRFFVRYSAPRTGTAADPCFGTTRGCHTAVLSEFRVSQADPNVADASSERVLFAVDQPQFNHNGGDVAFGPDGFLYFALGDGGGAHDGLADMPPSHGPIGHGQNVETALGSILRIDVDAGGFLPYGIPVDNPFLNTTGLDEAWAYGLRNPYRFSFDDGPGGTGRLFLGDVGQALIEEVDIIERGGNYGWVTREGTLCFDPFDPSVPPASCPSVGAGGEPLIDPIAEYDHDTGGLSVVGGYVYRGSQHPELACKYVFGDFSTNFAPANGRLFFLVEHDGGDFELAEFQIGLNDRPYGLYLKGFGEDEAGEIYVCGSEALAPTGTTGVVHRIVAVGTNYCSTSANSAGTGARIDTGGSLSVAANDLALSVDGLPVGSFGMFFGGAQEARLPLGQGVLCISPFAPGLFRVDPAVAIDASGQASVALDLATVGPAGAIAAGASWHFQFVYRDRDSSGAAVINLSDALTAIFCP